jgi:hypothetical protein
MESSDITSGLPDDYVTHGFTSLSRLNVEAQRVLEGLNQSDDAGNQYILVLNMPRAIRSQLDENKNVLQGINFRLMFDGTTALIKIVPSEPHETATSRLRDNISLSAVWLGRQFMTSYGAGRRLTGQAWLQTRESKRMIVHTTDPTAQGKSAARFGLRWLLRPAYPSP